MTRAAAVLFALAATASCRQIAGIQDLPPPCSDPLMIDDMEDGVGDICNTAGRRGVWSTTGDRSSTDLTPAHGAFKPELIPGGRGASRYAARFTGSGFTEWGALMAFYFSDEEMGSQLYDASGSYGIKFWMKSNVPVVVGFKMPETYGPFYGGNCPGFAAETNCFNDFSFEISSPGAGWVPYEVPFGSLTQFFGGTAFWNPKHLSGLRFMVREGEPFDVWVDDVSFYHCDAGGCLPTCTDPRFPVSCQDKNDHAGGCFPPGTICAAIDTWCVDPSLLDDMEDGDRAICRSSKRGGSWYTSGDGTSTDLTPEPGSISRPTLIGDSARGLSRLAARFTGSGFSDWGALMGVALDPRTDASAAGGITFWMKSNVPVAVQVPTATTMPPSYDGACTDTATARNCNNHFSFQITAPSGDWKKYDVPFTALRQSGSAVWDPREFAGVQFRVGAGGAFDVWVDDLAFYDCSGSTCVPTCANPRFPVQCTAQGAEAAGCFAPGTTCAASAGLGP